MQTSLQGIANRVQTDPTARFGSNRGSEQMDVLMRASKTEEPCAGKPHAGICEGGVG